MHTEAVTVAPALKALLDRFIDYAGIFPPAKLALDTAVSNYRAYSDGEHSWMLRWLVVNSSDVAVLPGSVNGQLSVLGVAPEARAASLETSSIVAAPQPVYCEVSLDKLDDLEGIKKSGCYAKMRTGGLKPEAIPTPAMVASFINRCAALRLPFKATAGLHHPFRAEYALTYEADAPRSLMHGFLNVLLASAFGWHGETELEPIIAETDPAAFLFDDRAHWRGKSLGVDEVRKARTEFIHSVGSCSFEEPIQDLKRLGLL